MMRGAAVALRPGTVPTGQPGVRQPGGAGAARPEPTGKMTDRGQRGADNMNYSVGEFVLRRPEPSDIEALYVQKNDPEIAALLGGFGMGYSVADLHDWVEYHRKRADEVVWAIVERATGKCVGHVGLYQIDHRVRDAEFAIMLGDRAAWGRGLGRGCTRFAVDYGFRQLNLNRVHLSVLATNERAIRLYHSLGFRDEGCLRQAQFKNGQYIDVLLMGMLASEYEPDARA
jgi:ribosomal-protein-alanine N-acetyltransferase